MVGSFFLKINEKKFVYLKYYSYVYTVRLRDMNELIEKMAVRVANGMKPTKVQMNKFIALPMSWEEREELFKKAIKEKKAEVEAKRAEILKAMGVRKNWETIGEPIPHNIKF